MYSRNLYHAPDGFHPSTSLPSDLTTVKRYFVEIWYMVAPVSTRFLSGPIITRDGEGMHALRGTLAAFHFNDSVAGFVFDIISRFIS